MALTPAAAALSKNATRIGANISKRLTRLASKDVKGGDILVDRLKAELESIKQMPVTNYREAQSKEARMRRLDKAAGTRAQSFQKAAKRAYNDYLVDQANDPFNVVRMSRDQLAEAYDVISSRLRGKVRRVREGIGGNNFMTRKVDELLEEDPKGATHNKLRSLVGRGVKDLKSKTLTVTGAKKQFQQGIELFGDAYKEMNDEQRGAVWEATHRHMEYMGLASTHVAEVIETVLKDEKFKALFFTTPTGKLQAVIAQGVNDAKGKQKQAQIENEVAKNILKEAFAKHGKGLPTFLREDETEEDRPLFF